MTLSAEDWFCLRFQKAFGLVREAAKSQVIKSRLACVEQITVFVKYTLITVLNK